MRKRERRSLILTGVVFVVLLACYLLLLERNWRAEHEDDGRTVYQMEKEEIDRLQFCGSSGTVSLIRRTGGWKYEEDESFPLNERFVETMLEKTAVLKAKRLVGQGRERFGEYGLDEPSNTICVDAGSQQKVIYLGDTNSATGDCYMSVEGSDRIYTVDATFPTLFSVGINEMASRETLPGMTLDTLTALEVENSGQNLKFEKGEMVQGMEGENSWSVSQGDETPMTADDGRVQTLLAQLIGLRYQAMVQYHPDEEQLEAYGLAQPQAWLRICYLDTEDQTEREFVLKIGDRTEDEMYFVYAENGAGVYTMNAESLEAFFYLAAEDFLSLNVAALKAETLTGLEIQTDSQEISYTIERQAARTEAIYRLNGQEIGEGDFNSIYYQLYALEADKRVTDLADQLTKKVVLTITYHREERDGGDLTVEFVPYDQNYYGIRTQGRAVLLINRQKVNQLLAYVQELR